MPLDNRLLNSLIEEATNRVQTRTSTTTSITSTTTTRENGEIIGNGRRYPNFGRGRFGRYNIPPPPLRIENHSIDISIDFINFLEYTYNSNDFNIYSCKSIIILSEFLLNKREDYNFQDLNKGIFKGVKSIRNLPDGYVSLNGKQKIKLGRILNGIYKLFYNSKNYDESYYIEKVINEYKSWNYDLDNFEFKYLDGTDILDGYTTSKQIGISSVMRNSCMNNMHSLLTIYTQNVDKISLLVLIDKRTNLILGRALIWELDNSQYRFMDRIYSAKDDIQNMFIQHARKNKMIYRTSRAEDDFMLFVPIGDDKYKRIINTKYKLSVKLNTKGIKKYPYFDSLYIKTKSKIFTNKLGFNIFVRYNTMKYTHGDTSRIKIRFFSK